MSNALRSLVARATDETCERIHVSARALLPSQRNRLYDAWVGDRRLIVKEFLKPAEYDDASRREHSALKRLTPLAVAPLPVCTL